MDGNLNQALLLLDSVLSELDSGVVECEVCEIDISTSDLDCVDLLKEVKAQLLMSLKNDGWISVEDRLPDEEVDVFVSGVRFNSQSFSVAGIFESEWVSQESERPTLFDVTHWKPIVPPK